MPEGLNMVFVDRGFNDAIDQLADSSVRTDDSVLTGQAIQLVRALVFWTRLAFSKKKNTGRARAGWWPAWAQLGVFGTPWGTEADVLSEAEGSFIDGRAKRGRPFFSMTNSVPYIGTLQDKDKILEHATSERMADMEREITRRYRRDMRRYSGR